MKEYSFLLVLVVLIFASTTSCSDGGMKKYHDTLEKNRAVVQKLDAAFVSGDTTMVDSILAADAVDHTPPPGMKGDARQMLKQIIAGFHAAFPDGKSTITAMVAQDDWVMQYATYSGTNSGSFMGMPATNKHVSFDFSDAFKLKDGKMVEHWGVIDMATMMQQMGPMPQASDTSMKKMDMPKQ